MEEEYSVQLKLKHLKEIDCAEIVALNTNSLVCRQMPLSDYQFEENACRKWVESKEQQWEQYGYGSWAF